MENTDYMALHIKQTLSDIKIFLNQDVQSLMECVSEYNAALAVAMKKGEKVKMKLIEMGSRSSAEWCRHFAQLGLLQHALNESQFMWIAAMQDLFGDPMKRVLNDNLSVFKQKSKMIKSALNYFEKEREKNRNLVQSMLAKPTLMRDVQPYYDEVKVKEELFERKKQEILQEIEFFRLDKAHEIGHLWAEVCHKQPYLTDNNLISIHSLPRPYSPPPSDWNTYCASRRSLQKEGLHQVNGKSFASSFYRGLKSIFHWHPKTDENDILRCDFSGSSESIEDRSIQISPHNASILTTDPSTLTPSSSTTPTPPSSDFSPSPSRVNSQNIPQLLLSPIDRVFSSSPSSSSSSSSSSPPPETISNASSSLSATNSPSSSSLISSPDPTLSASSITSLHSHDLNQPSSTSSSPAFNPSPVHLLRPSSSSDSSALHLRQPSSSHSSPLILQHLSPSSLSNSCSNMSISSEYNRIQNEESCASNLQIENKTVAEASNPPESAGYETELGDDVATSRSENSVVTMIPDSVETISNLTNLSIVSDDVPSIVTDDESEDEEEYEGDDSGSYSSGVSSVGKGVLRARIKFMQEWMPRTSESGRVVYVKRSDYQMQLK